MMKRIKILFKTGFYYYNMLAFITNGNKRFVDKKLIFGAMLIGLSSQYGCKTKNQNYSNQDNKNHDKIRITCYEVLASENKDSIENESINEKIEKTLIITSCYSSAESIDSSNDKYNNLKDTIYKISEFKDEEVYDDSLSEVICYVIVEQSPEFPGGDENLIKFLKENLIYPIKARENDIQGTVYLSFIVEETGTVSNVEIARGVSKDLNDEALRVVKLMPKWKPGQQRGKPQRVQFNMPIKFTLDTIKK